MLIDAGWASPEREPIRAFGALLAQLKSDSLIQLDNALSFGANTSNEENERCEYGNGTVAIPPVVCMSSNYHRLAVNSYKLYRFRTYHEEYTLILFVYLYLG